MKMSREERINMAHKALAAKLQGMSPEERTAWYKKRAEAARINRLQNGTPSRKEVFEKARGLIQDLRTTDEELLPLVQKYVGKRGPAKKWTPAEIIAVANATAAQLQKQGFATVGNSRGMTSILLDAHKEAQVLVLPREKRDLASVKSRGIIGDSFISLVERALTKAVRHAKNQELAKTVVPDAKPPASSPPPPVESPVPAANPHEGKDFFVKTEVRQEQHRGYSVDTIIDMRIRSAVLPLEDRLMEETARFEREIADLRAIIAKITPAAQVVSDAQVKAQLPKVGICGLMKSQGDDLIRMAKENGIVADIRWFEVNGDQPFKMDYLLMFRWQGHRETDMLGKKIDVLPERMKFVREGYTTAIKQLEVWLK